MTSHLIKTDTKLSDLAGQANAEHANAQRSARQAVAHAVNAGKFLLQAKSLLPHGNWSQWLTDNFAASGRTARAYMLLAKRLPELNESKRQRVANLPLRLALDALRGDPKSELELAEEFAKSADEVFSDFYRWLDEFPARLDEAKSVADYKAVIDEADQWHQQLWRIRIDAQRNVGRLLNELESAK
jgi:Protein of unknown function (DUF3102)